MHHPSLRLSRGPALLVLVAAASLTGCGASLDIREGCQANDECARGERCEAGACTPDDGTFLGEGEGEGDVVIHDARAPLDCSGVRTDDDSEYFVCVSGRTYDESRRICAQLDGHLVDLGDGDRPEGDAAEQGTIERLLTHKLISNAWMGLDDLVLEGGFRWAGGTLLDLAAASAAGRFAAGEPNDLDEDCVNEDAAGWNDNACLAALSSVCEDGPSIGTYPNDCTVLSTSAGGAYHFCTGARSFQAAQSVCESAGANLVSFGDQANATAAAEERDAVRAAVLARGPTLYWIGLSDRATENAFAWVKGNVALDAGFRPFQAGEPNNSGGGEDCVELTSLGWNDENCDQLRSSICER